MQSLTPQADDRCAFCGQLFEPYCETVLVQDDLGHAEWWHMACRDVLIPALLGRERQGTEEADRDIV